MNSTGELLGNVNEQKRNVKEMYILSKSSKKIFKKCRMKDFVSNSDEVIEQ